MNSGTLECELDKKDKKYLLGKSHDVLGAAEQLVSPGWLIRRIKGEVRTQIGSSRDRTRHDSR